MAAYDYDGSTEVIALCPSRENAEGALEMVRSFYATVRRIATEVIIVIDDDEPQRKEYLAIPDQVAKLQVGMGVIRPEPPRIMTVQGGSLTKATNEAVERLWNADSIVGHVGDDHRFITEGWDEDIRNAILEGYYVVYGYDGFRSAWASAWWTTMEVIRTLGWLAVPGSRHLTIDDVFMDIGAGLGEHPEERLKFLPETIIKHLHPAGGEVAWRPIVKSHYEKSRRLEEEENLLRYRNFQFAQDIEKLRTQLQLPHYPITDLSPGKTFRSLMKGIWSPAMAQATTRFKAPAPPERDLIALNGGRPFKNTADRLKTVRLWHQQWRAKNPGWQWM